MRTQTQMWLLSAAVMLGLSGLAGCGGEQGGDYRPFNKEKDKAPDAEHGHAHSHDHGEAHGPHHGDLIELGDEEFHAEAVFDEDANKITLYLLGPDAKTAVAIKAKELSLEMPGKEAPVAHGLSAAPLDGEAEGKSSRFEITSPELFEAFHHDPKIAGKFKVTLGGKEFTAAIKHEHDHGHDEAKPKK
ncbi:MAG: hypothetical protein ACKV2Q_34780 [Planctomycetaceae bacterium]